MKLWWEKSVLLVGKGLGKAKLVGKGLHRLGPVNIVLIKIQKIFWNCSLFEWLMTGNNRRC